MLSGPSSVVTSIVAGAASGLQFNPIAATATAVISAALVGFPRAPKSRVALAAVVLLAGWAIGDGISLAGAAGPRSGVVYPLMWAVSGFGVGYLLPALAGMAVGRRVVRGTGWLSAAAVALMLGPALSATGGVLGSLLWKAAA